MCRHFTPKIVITVYQPKLTKIDYFCHYIFLKLVFQFEKQCKCIGIGKNERLNMIKWPAILE